MVKTNRFVGSFFLLGIFLCPSLLISQEYLDLESSQSINHKIKIIVGLAQPLGAFGSNDIYSLNSGFALTGVSIGAEYNHELVEHVGIAFSVMANLHGHDEKEWRKELPWFSFHSEARQVYSAMIGPLFDIKVLPRLILYCSPQMGVVTSNYPNITVFDYTSQQFEIKAEWKSAIGYKMSVGTMTGMYDFGVQFLYSNPEFAPTYRYGRETGEYLPEKKPVKAIFFTAGLIVN